MSGLVQHKDGEFVPLGLPGAGTGATVDPAPRNEAQAAQAMPLAVPAGLGKVWPELGSHHAETDL